MTVCFPTSMTMAVIISCSDVIHGGRRPRRKGVDVLPERPEQRSLHHEEMIVVEGAKDAGSL